MVSTPSSRKASRTAAEPVNSRTSAFFSTASPSVLGLDWDRAGVAVVLLILFIFIVRQLRSLRRRSLLVLRIYIIDLLSLLAVVVSMLFFFLPDPPGLLLVLCYS